MQSMMMLHAEEVESLFPEGRVIQECFVIAEHRRVEKKIPDFTYYLKEVDPPEWIENVHSAHFFDDYGDAHDWIMVEGEKEYIYQIEKVFRII